MRKHNSNANKWILNILVLLISVLIIFTSSVGTQAQSQLDNPHQEKIIEPEYVPDEILIKLKPEAYEKALISVDADGDIVTGRGSLDKLHKKYGAKKMKQVLDKARDKSKRTLTPQAEQKRKNLKSIYKLKLKKGSVREAVSEYQDDPDVEYAEPNYISHALSISDPFYDDQWYGIDTKFDKAWDEIKSTNEVKVAVIDTGINMDHPDLQGKILNGYDFVNNDSDASDDHGHGTFVTGIISAVANDIGIKGLYDHARIIPVKVIDDDGFGTYEDTANGIIYAVDEGAEVLNLSVGGYSYSFVLQDSIDYALEEGCIVVAAGGNDGIEQEIYPAAYPDVIGVSALGYDRQIWSGSNTGKHIDVSAPGVDIISTDLSGDYVYATGTSASAAMVSALAAMLSSEKPDLSSSVVERLIIQSAKDLGEEGWDKIYGGGEVDALEALRKEVEPFHDVAVRRVSIEPLIVEKEKPTYITANIENTGTYKEELFDAVLYEIVGEERKEIEMKEGIVVINKTEVSFEWIPKDLMENVKFEIKIFLENDADSSNNSRTTPLMSVSEEGGLYVLYEVEPPVHQWIALQAYKLLESKDPKSDLVRELGHYLPTNPDAYWTKSDGKKVFYYLPKKEITGHDDDFSAPKGWEKDTERNSTVNTALIEGTWEEDIGSRPKRHFWNPDTNYDKGIYKCNSALEEAINNRINRAIEKYSSKNEDKAEAYYWLGRAAHLLMDMTVPEHVHLDEHMTDDSSYEKYTKVTYYNVRYDNLKNSSLLDIQTLPLDVPENYSNITIPGSYDGDNYKQSKFVKLFYNTAQFTQFFDSDDVDGNNTNALPMQTAWNITPDKGSKNKFYRGALNIGVPIDFNTTVTVSWARTDSDLILETDFTVSYSSGKIYLSEDIIKEASRYMGTDIFIVKYYNSGSLITTKMSYIYRNVTDILESDLESNQQKLQGHAIRAVATLYQLFWKKTHDVTVPDDFPTIQGAINNTPDGGIITVREGTYYENIILENRNLTLRAEGNVTIDGSNNRHDVVRISSRSYFTLDGFTITGIYPDLEHYFMFGDNGGIDCQDSVGTIRNCLISENSNEFLGGGIFASNCKLTITGCTIKNNKAGDGGGIFIDRSWLNMRDCIISDNDAISLEGYGNGYNPDNWMYGFGGGICSGMINSEVIIINSTISNNTAVAGGGISAGSYMAIAGCIIEGNSALITSEWDYMGAMNPGYGGGILGNPIITDSVISGNWALRGGGGIAGDPDITNCTIVGNKAGEIGGGIFYKNGNHLVGNCIFWENTAGTAGNDIYIDYKYITIIYSNINPSGISTNKYANYVLGEGNINTDPLFVSTASGNFHLTPTSPCIDTGVTVEDLHYYLYGYLFDIDGDTRPRDGDGLGSGTTGDGSDYDMGADEYKRCLDMDGDGYFAEAGCGTTVDCNDLDSSINPIADDLCDGVDNNCDGLIDEGLLFTYYRDNDSDGYGDPSDSANYCTSTPPATYVSDNNDCDDNNAAINPGANEIVDDQDNNCNGLVDETCTDTDGDGYFVEAVCGKAVDCDDNNTAINPGVTETCDGVDNNCDGLIDEGLLFTYYRDNDSDGYGDPSDSANYCTSTPPATYVSDNSDCDDNNTAINPGETEVLDDQDNNCDGQVDEGFCTDRDSDGYYTQTGCDTAVDCDDTDQEINPGVTEICDGVDNNCDGLIDEGLLYTYYRDKDSDGYGDLLDSVNYCSPTPPATYVSDNSDCDDNNTAINPGATEVCDGLDNNCNGIPDDGANADCDDGLFCTGVEKCVSGSCQSGTAVDCSYKNDQCNDGVCDEDIDECEAQPKPGNPACDDGDICTENDFCVAGYCQSGNDLDCNDSDSYTYDYCDPAIGCINKLVLYVDDDYASPVHPACIDRTGTADDPYCKVQDGINAAPDGYMVLVSGGTYLENINFNKKAITVSTYEGAIIDANGSGSVVTFNQGEGPDSVLDGFTITGGNSSYAGGIYCDNSSSPSIINCKIFSNWASYAGGIFCSYYSSPVITNCEIRGNSAYNSVGGIGCWNNCSPTITNCTISGNRCDGGHGGIMLVDSSAIITNCTIAANWGRGIYYNNNSSSPLVVVNSIIWGNQPYGIKGAELTYDDIIVRYSDIQGSWLGEGNIHADPMFVFPMESSKSPTTAGDYRLTSGSPCFDSGTNDDVSYPTLPVMDLDYILRPVDWGYDMGAYELRESDPQIWYKDIDDDGYSDGTTTGPLCNRPDGYKLAEELIATTGDSDDTRWIINVPQPPVSFVTDYWAYWNFNEGEGNIVFNSSSSGNYFNGKILGATWTKGISGFGNALHLDGTISQYVGLPYSIMNDLDNFTVEFWAKTTGGGETILSGANSDNANAFVIEGQHNLNIVQNRFGWRTDVSFNDGLWHHIVFTREGSVAKVYKDGVEAASTISFPSEPLIIDPGGLILGQDQDEVGGGFDRGQSFDGTLDELAIYNRALSAVEVSQRYNEKYFYDLSDYTPPNFSIGMVKGEDTKTGGTVKLSWNIASDRSTPITYNIYYAPSSAPLDYSTPKASTLKPPYWVSGLADGTEYRFAVRAVDALGNEDSNTKEYLVTPSYRYNSFLTSEALGYWDFNEKSGNKLINHSKYGTKYNGELIGNAEKVRTTSGRLGNALLGGTFYDYASIPYQVMDGLTDLTVEFWVKVDGGSRAGLFSGATSYDGDHNNFLLFDQLNLSLHVKQSPPWRSGLYVADGIWHHVVVTRSNSEVKIYKDGILGGFTTTMPVGPQKIDPGALVLGKDQDCTGGCYDQGLDGLLDELVIYDRVLTEYEVQTRYYEVGPLPIFTPEGSSVEISFPFVDITFDEILPGGGETSVTTSPDGTALPVNFQAAGQYYEIFTTAEFSGPIAVCFYFPAHMTPIQKENSSLLYFNSSIGDWEDITTSVDIANNRICRVTDIFSEFVIAYPGDSRSVGFWMLDEGSGYVALDLSDNINDGMVNGASWTTDGLIGNALNFDGNGDYVNAGNDSSLRITDQITVEAWFELNTSGSYQMIVSKTDNGGYQLGYDNEEFYNDEIAFMVHTDGNYKHAGVSIDYIALDTWYHVVGTYDGSKIRFYLNGMERASTDVTGPITDTPNTCVFIGEEPDNCSPRGWSFNGVIDEVAIYNQALSSAEIKDLYLDGGGSLDKTPPTFSGLESTLDAHTDGSVHLSWSTASDPNMPITYNIYYATMSGKQKFSQPDATTFNTTCQISGLTSDQPYYFVVRAEDFNGNEDNNEVELTVVPTASSVSIPAAAVAYWNFDEGTGDITFDGSSNNNNGTINGASWTTGMSGNALSFNGNGNYVNAGNDSSLRITGQITVGAWFRMNTSGSYQMIVSKTDGGGYQLGYDNDGLYNGKLAFMIHTNGSYKHAGISIADIALDTWYYVVGTYDGSKIRFYLNGVERASTDATGPITDTPDTCVFIGEEPDSCSPRGWSFNGDIDEVVIYDRALSPSEITDLYFGEGGSLDTTPPTFSGLASATDAQTDGEVNLSWSAANDPGMPITYHTYYAISSGGQDFSTPNIITQDISYQVTGLINDQSYYFVVRAEDVYGNEDTNTVELSVIPTASSVSIPAGAVAYWNFDEGSGNTALDQSDNSNDGTINGASWTDGMSGNALSFNGNEKYVNAGNDSSLRITGQITVGAWFRMNTSGSYQMIVSKTDGGGYQLGYDNDGLYNDKLAFMIHTNGSYKHAGVNIADIALDTWYHVVGTYDGSQIKLYLNGVEQASTDATGPITDTPNTCVFIGDEPYQCLSSYWSFNGDIDEVVIYDRALTTGEIQDYYNAMTGQ